MAASSNGLYDAGMNQDSEDIVPPRDEDNSPANSGEGPADASHAIRLQRFLAQCGLGARRECEALVTSGRVTVDGTPVTELGTKVDPKRQDIRLDGQRLKPQQRQTWVFNKPPGVLCTMKDPQHRPRVVDFFPASGPRLFTVGRLDESSTGLLVVTNDGDLAQKLAHPKYRIYRTYHIQVAGIPSRDALTAVKQGLWFAEGKFRVQSAKVLKRQGRSSILEVVLREGQNREVRRLFDRVGHKVMKLKRVAFGPIRLGSLSMGKHRPVTQEEMTALRQILERNERPPGAEAESTEGRRPRPRRGKPPRQPARPAAGSVREEFETEGDERPRRPRRPVSGGRRPGKPTEGRAFEGQAEEGQGGRRFDRRRAEGRPADRRRTGGRPADRRSTGGRPFEEAEGSKERASRRGKARRTQAGTGESQGKRPFRPRRPGKPRPPGKPRHQGKPKRPGRDRRRESGDEA